MNVESMIWQEGWCPTTDSEVTQLLKYLSDKEKETSRVVNSAQEEIALLSKIGQDAQDKYDHLKSKITSLLERYVLEEVDKEDRKETKTTYKYKLARGEIVINKPSKKIEKPSVIDEITLSAEFPSFVKSEPVFKWGDFKKELELDDDGKVIYKKTGKVLTNIPVVETPQVTKINLSL